MMSERIGQYAVYERHFLAAQRYTNPYREVTARATCTDPEGAERSIALYWEDGARWGLRFSPDRVGLWRWVVSSSDPGLHGQSGAFACVDSDLHGGLMPMEHHPLHFQYQDGTPVWLLGDTQWRALATDEAQRLDRDSVLHGIDVRLAQGFNYVHADVMGGAGTDGGEHVFLDWQDEVPNAAFFKEMDARVQAMSSRGLTLGLVLAWSTGAESWASFASDEARLRYARYIVARYSAYYIVFIVSGERDLGGAEYASRYTEIGKAIGETDPHRRMCGIHAGGERSVQCFAVQDWMSFGDYQQIYRAPPDREATLDERWSLHNRLLAPRIHGKPVVNAEYAYYLRDMSADRSYWRRQIAGVDKQHSHTRASFRRASWVLAMAGGYIVTGFGTTYFGGWRNPGPFDVDDPRNDDAESDLQHLRAFFSATEWWRLFPMDGLVSTDEGRAYCLAELSCIYLVYAEGTRSVLLEPDGESDTHYAVTRFDPRTGIGSALAEQGGDTIRLVCPDRQDWSFTVQALASSTE